jgi:hypothetical protein
MDSDLDLSDHEEVKSSDYGSALGWDHTQDVEFDESDDECEVKIHTDPSDSEQSIITRLIRLSPSRGRRGGARQSALRITCAVRW